MIYTRQRVEGFEATPWLNGTKGNFLNDMSGWIKEGKVTTALVYLTHCSACLRAQSIDRFRCDSLLLCSGVVLGAPL